MGIYIWNIPDSLKKQIKFFQINLVGGDMINTGLSINNVNAYNNNVKNMPNIYQTYGNINSHSNDDIDQLAKMFIANVRQFEEKNGKGDLITKPTLIEYIKSQPYNGYEAQQQKIVNQLIDEIPESYHPLHAAAYYGYDDIMKFLLAQEGTDVNVKNDNGDTPLFIASFTDNLQVIKFLVSRGANITIKNNEGFSALHIAARYNAVDVVSYLVGEGIDVNTQTNYNDTPLHYAVMSGQEDTIKLLIGLGADINAQDKYGYTPLHIAIRKKYTDSAKLLIEKGADINIQDKDGNTPLHDAAGSRQNDIIKLLIEKGADINVQNNDGNTPLHIAIIEEHVDSAKLLIEKGANINQQYKDGNTFLHDVAWFGQNDIIELLIKKGADINAQNNYGNTPLDVAIMGKHADSAELLKKGAKDGYTPLDNTIRQERVDSAIDKDLEESDINIESTVAAHGNSINTDNKTFVKGSQNHDNNILAPLYYYLAAVAGGVISLVGGGTYYLLNKKQHQKESASNDMSYYNYQSPKSNLTKFMGKPVVNCKKTVQSGQEVWAPINEDDTTKVCVIVTADHKTADHKKEYRPISKFLIECFNNNVIFLDEYSPKTVQKGSSPTAQEKNSSTVEVGSNHTVQEGNSSIVEVESSSPTAEEKSSNVDHYDYLPPARPVSSFPPDIGDNCAVDFIGDIELVVKL